MNGAFEIGAMGLHAQQGALEIVASNITNMNTPGYKRSQARFADLVAGPAAGQGNQTGTSAIMLHAAEQVFSQGELRPTGNILDIAIDGTGFIELMGPDGEIQLWRGGTLKINADGFLAAANGLQLKSLISVPDGSQDITIGRDGTVSATVPGDEEPRELGRIDVIRVRDMGGLVATGGGLFTIPDDPRGIATAVAGEEGTGAILQGQIEQSNVLLTDEMVTLMMMQRSYAASAQVVQAGDQLMSIANNLRRS